MNRASKEKPFGYFVFCFIWLMVYIWVFAQRNDWLRWGAIIPIAVPILNYWMNKPEDFKKLWIPNCDGCSPKQEYLHCGIAFAVFWIALLAVGLSVNPNSYSLENLKNALSNLSTWLYPFGALGQQIILNGFFVPKIDAFIKEQNPEDYSFYKTAMASGILFGIVHLPSPVLFPVTAIGGIASVYFYRKTKNLYLIAILHAILAITIKYALPDAWHHNLRIGPGYYSYIVH